MRAVAGVCLVAFPVACGRSVAEPPPEAPRPTEARLRAGDAIRLEVWREPALSGQFLVDEGGTVILPKIGPMTATGVPTTELKRRILDEFYRYLRNPSITITFLRRITVTGAVRAPGVYPVDPTMTVSDVVALAGGPVSYGDPNEVELYRNGRRITANIQQIMPIDALAIRSGDQLYVPERSWIERHTGILTTAISSVVSIGLTVFTILATRSNDDPES